MKMLKLALNELKQIAKMRGIKDCKSMSEERLVSYIKESESEEGSENNFDGSRVRNIKKDLNKLRDRLSKPKIKDIRKYIHKTENKK